MDRRDFLVQTGTMLAGASLAPRSLGMVAQDQPGGGQQGRIVLPINRNWRYSPKVVDGGHAIAFDDSGFDHGVVSRTPTAACRGTASTKSRMSSSRSIAGRSNCLLRPRASVSSSTLKA